MSKKTDRKTLKGYFQTGKIPTEAQFAEFIDSVPNIVDDGLASTDKYNVAIYPQNTSGGLIKIYEEGPKNGTDIPCWSLSLDKEKNLLLANKQGEKVLLIHQNRVISFYGNLSFEADKADRTSGTINIEQNVSECLTIPPDGEWHTVLSETAIPEYPAKCQTYRIFICYKYAKKDKYKTMEVVASHCNANNLKLRFRSKFCGFWFSKMLLRWKKEEDSLLLQMRCKFPKITLSQIQYRITELWSYTENDNR